MPDIRRVEAKRFMTPTRIGGHDFTCNPYVGCAHGCIYCYAKTLGDQPARPEPWGSFVEVKNYPNFDIPRNTGSKSLFFSSATDCYQPAEAQERLTRAILEAIRESALRISVLTKSALVTRDIDLFAGMRDVEVGFSISLTDAAARDVEPGASLPSARIAALRMLKAAGIRTYVFVSPILPYVSEPLAVLEAVAPFVDYVMFDTLNLRSPENKLAVFRYVMRHRPERMPAYKDIFENQNHSYYNNLRYEIVDRARALGVKIGYLYDWR